MFDVIIIGARIIGSYIATTYKVVKRGDKVLLLKQFNFLDHLGLSHGKCQTIQATYPKDY